MPPAPRIGLVQPHPGPSHGSGRSPLKSRHRRDLPLRVASRPL